METLIFALGLGLSSGLSPGPLTVLILSTTLQRGLRAGLRVAVAPLATDGLMITVALLVLARLPLAVLPWIGTVGGLVLVLLGASTLRNARSAEVRPDEESTHHRDLWHGAVVNLFNPAPWIFWFTAGGPLVIRAWSDHPAYAVGFVLIFVSLLVACKAAIAWLAARGRRFLAGPTYRLTLALLGALLVALGLRMVWVHLPGG